ncbi:hypothetical protein ACFYQA_39325 [Streptomyces sp. NPDC005774]|uniref:hypothetical protein n=1 Tax=Streptomyces sp. NPDC005774 TaxID=3364728 RepID=UPI0036C2E6A6
MVRRPVAWIVALVLFAEGLGVAALNWLLGVVVDRQDMSLAGLDPHMTSVSSKAAGIVFGLYFALCGLVALLVALRDRAPSGAGRALLISAAVVHALLGAFVWGLVGVSAFLSMAMVLALIVLLLMTYDPEGRPGGPADAAGPTGPADAAGPTGPADAAGPAGPAGPAESAESAGGGEGDGADGSPVTSPAAPTVA